MNRNFPVIPFSPSNAVLQSGDGCMLLRVLRKYIATCRTKVNRKKKFVLEQHVHV